jgi:predicted Zn finger-like uncharacterized protein
MIILCPSCSHAHEIDPAYLGSHGRKVRCSNCRTPWFVPAQSSMSEEEMEDMVRRELEEIDKRPLPSSGSSSVSDDMMSNRPVMTAKIRSKNKTSDMQLVGKLFSFITAPMRLLPMGPILAVSCLAVVAYGLMGRTQIVRTFPETAKFYETIGFPVNLRGLDFAKVRSETTTSDQEAFLVVEGDIVNIAGKIMPVPPLEIVLRDQNSQKLYTWTVDPPRPELNAGETMKFRARLASPPEDAKKVFVRFPVEKSKPQASTAAHL